MARAPARLPAAFLAVFLAFATLFLLTPPAADAQQRALNCNRATTMIQMTQCAQQRYEAADLELNATYKTCVATMRNMGDIPGLRISKAELPEARLRESQRKWLAYRDANCAFYRSHSMGGTMGSLNYLACMTKMTSDRSAELKQAMQVEPAEEGIVEGRY